MRVGLKSWTYHITLLMQLSRGVIGCLALGFIPLRDHAVSRFGPLLRHGRPLGTSHDWCGNSIMLLLSCILRDSAPQVGSRQSAKVCLSTSPGPPSSAELVTWQC
eukprot:4054389-Amphidinium_carterae.1